MNKNYNTGVVSKYIVSFSHNYYIDTNKKGTNNTHKQNFINS